MGPYVKGCVLNFLDHMGPDGSVPYCLNARVPAPPPVPRPADSPANAIKPLLAQMTRLARSYLPAGDWIGDVYPGLRRYLDHWQRTQYVERLGLFVFRSHRGSGADNHPGVYGRPLDSSADVFLNAMMVREYRAMSVLAADTAPEDEADWHRRAESLAAAMQRMWDPVDGMFYNLDAQVHEIENVNQPVNWVVPLKFRMWTGLTAMWAGVATDEQAETRVRDHILDASGFRGEAGLRSLARVEPTYCTFAGSNPSNWQGPVWVVSNYLVFRGLLDYGYKREAEELAQRLLRTLARDVEANGCLHEYYHPETGEGLTHPGFLNWNTLGTLLIDEIEGARLA